MRVLPVLALAVQAQEANPYDDVDLVPTTTEAPIANCMRYDQDGQTIYMTPEYYVPHMDCFTEFFCDKPGESVHFSFDYFKTEKDFDRLQIKSPGTGEEGIEDDWDLWFDGHKVAENVWQDTKLPNVELEFHSDYTDTNEYADSAADIGFKVRLQCARQGTLEKPAAAGGRPCAQLVRAEAIMGAIEGVAYMIGGIMRVAAAAQTVEHL